MHNKVGRPNIINQVNIEALCLNGQGAFFIGNSSLLVDDLN